MKAKNIHETQPEKPIKGDSFNDQYVDENLRSMQQIEGGGPMRKIDLHTMPRPLRIFGYFFISIVVLMGATAVLVSFIR